MKKLLVILGAGASIEAGMPSVKEIDELFDTWSQDSFSCTNSESKNLYKWVKEKVEGFYLSNNTRNKTVNQNFETILYTIQMLSVLSDNSVDEFKNSKGLGAFIKIKDYPEIKNFFKKEVIPSSSTFQDLQSHLIDKLLFFIRKKCQNLDVDKKEEISKIRGFFNILKEDYDLGFINLNYDNVILTALPELTTGYSKTTGKFDKDEFYNDNWGFCYHIHGSVHFDMKTNGVKLHEISWNNNLKSSFNTKSKEKNVDYTSEGNYCLNSTIITGLDKANQILREPFMQYFMKIDKLIHESDSILFIGYGFGDLHLSKLFPLHRLSPTKKRQVVVIDYFPDETEALYKRQDDWPTKLFKTIPFNGHEMGDGREDIPPDTIIDYKKNKCFEFSRNDKYPLSLWHSGFLNACDNADIVRKELLK